MSTQFSACSGPAALELSLKLLVGHGIDMSQQPITFLLLKIQILSDLLLSSVPSRGAKTITRS